MRNLTVAISPRAGERTTMNNGPREIRDALGKFIQQGESLYALLDAAQSSEIPYRLKFTKTEHDSLYRGRSEEALWYVAPYLAVCEPDSDFVEWVLTHGWGNSWAVFLTSGADLESLRKHFRQFLLVKAEDDRDYYFRFYDPRVLRVFLPTCDLTEAREFFGPVSRFLMEGETSEALLSFAASEQGTSQEAVLL